MDINNALARLGVALDDLTTGEGALGLAAGHADLNTALKLRRVGDEVAALGIRVSRLAARIERSGS
jgi:hypothetical protein